MEWRVLDSPPNPHILSNNTAPYFSVYEIINEIFGDKIKNLLRNKVIIEKVKGHII